MNGKMKRSAVAEYKRLREAADEARARTNETRAALRRHQAEHNC